MNTHTVKAFFSKFFGKNSTPVVCDDCSVNPSLKAINARVIEISNFTTTAEFADMVMNRPHEVRKLRAELDPLVVESTNI